MVGMIAEEDYEEEYPFEEGKAITIEDREEMALFELLDEATSNGGDEAIRFIKAYSMLTEVILQRLSINATLGALTKKEK